MPQQGDQTRRGAEMLLSKLCFQVTLEKINKRADSLRASETSQQMQGKKRGPKSCLHTKKLVSNRTSC